MTEPDRAVLIDALSAPTAPLRGPTGGRSVVVTTVAVEPDAGGGLVGTAEVWLRHAGQGARPVGEHVVALRRVPELEATALALSAPDELAGMLVGHTMVRLAAADVARVRGRGAPPGRHAAWARVLGWDPVAADHNGAELAAAMSRGCQALVEEGYPAADVVRFVADLRRAVRVSWMASVRRPDVLGHPGVKDAAVRRFWERVLAHVTPAELAGMGPVVEAGEHVGAWVLRRGGAEWVGVHEFNPLGARLARAMRRAELQPHYGTGFHPRGLGA
ncbi:MAG: hypothetical protein ACRD03_06395 [Acidimicrobiales bacterium]